MRVTVRFMTYLVYYKLGSSERHKVAIKHNLCLDSSNFNSALVQVWWGEEEWKDCLCLYQGILASVSIIIVLIINIEEISQYSTT